ncbi:hypothetical protein CH302_17090 [Rhodococcus sp. 15-2388-1-1a]|nr:hypothetical protein CH302_17090 [Rhodococcus sp. 15-2388-1-1a]
MPKGADNRSPEPDAKEDDSASTVDSSDIDSDAPKKRTRRTRNFPGTSFKEALFLADAIQKHASGQKVRRLTLFEALNRAPTSGTSRNLVTASGQYGITIGGYNADFLELTPLGRSASDKGLDEARRVAAQIQLAILDVEPFKTVFEQFVGLRLPTVEVLKDAFKSAGVEDDVVSEAVEIFLANAREVGLVRTIAGSEHLVAADAVLEQVASNDSVPSAGKDTPTSQNGPTTALPPLQNHGSPQSLASRWAVQADDLSSTCFIVSPIGAPDSEQRQHADLVLGSLIEPALAELGLRAVRADQISKPGLITGQVIEHIAKAALVIADLSFANPNVYYELALRHAVQKPVVQITRSSDTLPFDVGQYRTVTVDMTNIYTLVPQIELHRQEITRQCRAALAEGIPSQTQLTLFYPDFWDHIGVETS